MEFWNALETVLQIASIICDTILIVLLVRQLESKG